MAAVLCVLAVIAAVFISGAECGGKERTPACYICDWVLTVKTSDAADSGTNCPRDIRLKIFTADGRSSYWKQLKTSNDDYQTGKIDRFTLDIWREMYEKIAYYVIANPDGVCSWDNWQPQWTELRNKNRPSQITRGSCAYPSGTWLGSMYRGIRCERGSGTACELDYYMAKSGVDVKRGDDPDRHSCEKP